MTHQFAAPQTGSVADRRSADRRPGSLETFELRWFARGPIPAAATGWFEEVARQVVVEKRVDSYLLTGRADLGVKRRDQGPLEVKERRRIGRQMAVGGRLVGHVEEWHKQTVDRLPVEDDRWVEVAKAVLTDPYRVTGSDGRTAACDIELAAVETGGLEAWTLAFEASGLASDRMATLEAAVEQFLSASDVPADLAAALELEAGYPAWLAAVTGT